MTYPDLEAPIITEEMLKQVGREANLDQLALVLFHECRHQPESGKGIARIREELVKQYTYGLQQSARTANSGKVLYQTGYKDGRSYQLEECERKVKKYFKGLIVIPDPQATKYRLLLALRQEIKKG